MSWSLPRPIQSRERGAARFTARRAGGPHATTTELWGSSRPRAITRRRRFAPPTSGWADGREANSVRVVERHRARPPDPIDGHRPPPGLWDRAALHHPLARGAGGP